MYNGQGVNGRQDSPLPPVPTRGELETAGIRIVVGIPMERNITDAAFNHFWNIARQGWPLVDHLYGRTDSNRNRMARVLKEEVPEFTHLCMLDGDHLHPADTVLKLARWVLDDPGKLVVGGWHFRRGEPFEPCAFCYGSDGELHAPVEWNNGLMEVDAIGHGTLLIHRSVFDILPTPWWAYSYVHAEKYIYPSVDMYFSHLRRQFGVKMYADTTQTSPHLITSVVEESTFRAFLDENPHKIIRNNRVEVGGMA
jgi:hypothetical protein